MTATGNLPEKNIDVESGGGRRLRQEEPGTSYITYYKKVRFTQEEQNFLQELIRVCDVVETKQSDARSNFRKKEAWLKITDEFNSRPGHNRRTVAQLQKCWDNIKTKRKKEMTGGDKTQLKKQDLQDVDCDLLSPVVEIQQLSDSEPSAGPATTRRRTSSVTHTPDSGQGMFEVDRAPEENGSLRSNRTAVPYRPFARTAFGRKNRKSRRSLEEQLAVERHQLQEEREQVLHGLRVEELEIKKKIAIEYLLMAKEERAAAARKTELEELNLKKKF